MNSLVIAGRLAPLLPGALPFRNAPFAPGAARPCRRPTWTTNLLDLIAATQLQLVEYAARWVLLELYDDLPVHSINANASALNMPTPAGAGSPFRESVHIKRFWRRPCIRRLRPQLAERRDGLARTPIESPCCREG